VTPACGFPHADWLFLYFAAMRLMIGRLRVDSHTNVWFNKSISSLKKPTQYWECGRDSLGQLLLPGAIEMWRIL